MCTGFNVPAFYISRFSQANKKSLFGKSEELQTNPRRLQKNTKNTTSFPYVSSVCIKCTIRLHSMSIEFMSIQSDMRNVNTVQINVDLFIIEAWYQTGVFFILKCWFPTETPLFVFH